MSSQPPYSNDGDAASGSAPDPVLASFRKSIDNIDAALIHMLAERFRITQAVGEYKAKVTLPPADPASYPKRPISIPSAARNSCVSSLMR